jgi:hypothetical protein
VLSRQDNRVVCREIGDSDLNEVIAVLLKGYHHPTEHWISCLERLGRHSTPPGFPKYGYLLESGGKVIGVILLIHSTVPTDGGYAVKCNIAGWSVEPAFSSYAPMLHSRGLKRKDVTYINVPGPHIQTIVEAMGFSRYCDGQFMAILALSRAIGLRATVIRAGATPEVKYDSYDQNLLREHGQFGCLSFWCTTAEKAYPFVFLPMNVRGFIPCVRLIYCRSTEDLVRFAQPIGRYLLKYGRVFTLIDANGPITGLLGHYFANSRPKYFKGPMRPRLGDLSYTNLSMF